MSRQRLPERLLFSLVGLVLVWVTLAVSREIAAPTDPVVRVQRMLNSIPLGRLALPLFSPDDNIKEVLIGLIRATRGRIYVAVYMFTDPDIADALIERYRAGVPVELVVDHNCALTEWSKIPKIRRSGVPVYVFPGKAQAGRRDLLMHNKYLVCLNVLGRSAVTVTGSFNFTRSANGSNHENMIVLDAHAVAQRYIERFGQIKRESKLFSVPIRRTAQKTSPEKKELAWIISALCRYLGDSADRPERAATA